MKGIILAGGSGTRLYPMTRAFTKGLLPIYDRPTIFYPFATLMNAGIRDILLITTRDDLRLYEKLLGDGSAWGLNLEYTVQDAPNGIAEAIVIGADFIGNDRYALILGDNIFYGPGLWQRIAKAAGAEDGGTVFAYQVSNPNRYGVVDFNADNIATSLEEKPLKAKSNWAVTGLYIFGPRSVEIARALKPSARGELEITDVNSAYLAEGRLTVERLDAGHLWLDTGTPQSMAEAGELIMGLENRQGVKVCCPEEAAFRQGFISKDQLMALGQEMAKTAYGQYLIEMAERGTPDPH